MRTQLREINDFEEDLIEGKDLINLHFSWSKWYIDMEHLAEDSDLVITATVESNEGTIITGENYFDYKQKSIIKIDEVLKGDSSLVYKNINLYQMGGEDENAVVKYHGTTPLAANEKVILFLKRTEGNDYIPINEDVSIFKVNSLGEYENLLSEVSFTKNTLMTDSALVAGK